MVRSLAIVALLLGGFAPATSTAVAADCLAPITPFDYEVEAGDDLYDEARREYRQYLVDLKGYLECLDREAFVTEKLLREGVQTFRKNFPVETAAVEDDEETTGENSPEITPPGAYE